ncbi:MAG: hypothetical protein ABR508_10060 [Candidatus Baltobacteraceae bacterium]
MRQIGTANITRGSMAWVNPFRFKLAHVTHRPHIRVESARVQAAPCVIDRGVDFIADVRDLQTPPEVLAGGERAP